MESLRELFIKLGLSVNAAEFAEGIAWEHALEEGAHLVVEAVEELGEIFIESVHHTAEFGEQMDLLSQKTGVSVEQIQKLSYAAGLSGASADDLRVSITHLARASEAAQGGNEEAIKTFHKLGLSMEQLKKDSPDELMLAISEKFKELGPGAKRTALAMDVFGRSGTALIPMLGAGREEIEKLGLEAEELGIVMSAEAAHSAHEFDDELRKMHETAVGLEHELAGPLIEALLPIVQEILHWVKANRQLISQKVQTFAHGVGMAISVMGRTMVGIGKVAMFLVDNLKLLAFVLGGVVLAALIVTNGGLLQMLVNVTLNSLAYVLLGVQAVAAAVKATIAWLAAAAPIAAVAALLILAALAAEDFYYFLTDGDSLLGDFLNEKGKQFSDWLKEVSAPHTGDFWLTAQLRSLLGVLTDIEPYLDKLGAIGAILSQTSGLNAAKQIAGSSVGEHAAFDDAADQAQRIKTTQAIYGGGGSPGTSAIAAAQGANYVHAPSFSAQIHIAQGPGQSAGALADNITNQLDDWWNSKMREAAPVAGQ